MELDDLRRHWRQPEPVPAPALTARELNALLKGRTSSLVEQMRRSAWFEIGLTLVVTALILGVMAYLLVLVRRVPGQLFSNRLLGLVAGILLVLLLIMLVYYRRLLGVLRRMMEPAASVYGHLTVLAQGLRQLLRFYYYLSIWSGPAVLLLLLAYIAGHELGRPGVVHWRHLAGIMTGMAAGVGVAQVGIVYLTRWYVQRLYGRHLDRLEGQLRELSEDELPAA